MRHSHEHSAALAAAISLSFVSGCRSRREAPTRLGPVVVTANRAPMPRRPTRWPRSPCSRARTSSAARRPTCSTCWRARPASTSPAPAAPARPARSSCAAATPATRWCWSTACASTPATQGIFDFAHLPLAQVERIEIVRGPRAALWGSDAIGGVIQMFTRDPSKSFVSRRRRGSYGRAGVIGRHRPRVRRCRGSASRVGGERLRRFFGDQRSQLPLRLRSRRWTATTTATLGLRAQTPRSARRASRRPRWSPMPTSSSTRATDRGEEPRLLRSAACPACARRQLPSWTHALMLGHSSEDLDTPVYLSRFGSERDSLDWINIAWRSDDGTTRSTSASTASRETGYSIEGFGGGFERIAAQQRALFVSWREPASAAICCEASLRHDHNSQFGGADHRQRRLGLAGRRPLRLRASLGPGLPRAQLQRTLLPGFRIARPVPVRRQPGAASPSVRDSAEVGLDWTPGCTAGVGLSAVPHPHQRPDRVRRAPASRPSTSAAHRSTASSSSTASQLAALAAARQCHLAGCARRRHGMPLLRRRRRKCSVLRRLPLRQPAPALGIDLSAVSARPDFGGIDAGRLRPRGPARVGAAGQRLDASRRGWRTSATSDYELV